MFYFSNAFFIFIICIWLLHFFLLVLSICFAALCCPAILPVSCSFSLDIIYGNPKTWVTIGFLQSMFVFIYLLLCLSWESIKVIRLYMFRGRYLRSYLLWYEAANVGKSQFVPSKLSVVLFPNSQKKICHSSGSYPYLRISYELLQLGHHLGLTLCLLAPHISKTAA